MKVHQTKINTLKNVEQFRTYIQNHWEFIGDWRKRTEKIPKGARGLGAMESNQRNVSFRMKRRGMHWSQEGAEAMVKVKQGRLNGRLREVYLLGQRRSTRKQRTFKRPVHMSNILRQKTRPSVGVKSGSISVHAAHSSAIGRLAIYNHLVNEVLTVGFVVTEEVLIVVETQLIHLLSGRN